MSSGPAPIAISADAPHKPRLSAGSLVRISLYWLGLSSIFIGLNAILTGRMESGELGAAVQASVGTTLFQLTVAGALIAAIIQPTVGAISDYTVSRWGRRKPYIVLGTVLDLVFLAGIAFSNELVAIAAFIVLLQVSSNLAQGPFQGYIPDLVPAEQSGTASSLVGLFSVLGNVAGFGIAAAAIATSNFAIGLLAIGALEFLTMFSVVLRVPAGPAPKSRAGRSWLAIAREAWGTDILKERSFVFIVLSRWLILMGGTMLINFSTLYLTRTFDLAASETFLPNMGILAATVIGNLVAVIPAGRLGDRYGRKRVIYLACLIAAAGMALCAVAPSIPFAIAGSALFGTGLGAFLAVDWALLTSVVPGASGGRYMGISNVATATAGIAAIATGGPLLDAVDAASRGDGPRAAFLLAVLFLILGILPLRLVREPGRDRIAD